MDSELETHVVELTPGISFRYDGPQTAFQVYFGTVGETPEYSNEILKRFSDLHGDKNVAQVVPNANVTLVSTATSPWVLLQFPELRREEIVERLRDVVAAASNKACTESENERDITNG